MRLSSDEYLLVQQFKDFFGVQQYRSMLKNFGPHYDDVTELSSKRMNKCLKMMKEQIDLHNAREILTQRDKSKLRDNHRRVMSKDDSRIERVWITKTGREMPISRMKDDHLHNTILLLDRSIAYGTWRLGLNEDLPDLLVEMESERKRRKMPLPLIPLKSLEYRRRNQND